MTYTPGPWVEDEYKGGWIEGVVEYAGCGSHEAEWSSEANKRLAFAAPDLLEALEQLLGNSEIARFHLQSTESGMIVGSALFDTIQQARAAIAKAIGVAA